jgi:hypothetical protein
MEQAIYPTRKELQLTRPPLAEVNIEVQRLSQVDLAKIVLVAACQKCCGLWTHLRIDLDLNSKALERVLNLFDSGTWSTVYSLVENAQLNFGMTEQHVEFHWQPKFLEVYPFGLIHGEVYNRLALRISVQNSLRDPEISLPSVIIRVVDVTSFDPDYML